jgi:hypothetical protein
VSDNVRLRWCLDASIAELTSQPADRLGFKIRDSRRERSPGSEQDDWRRLLTEIRRDRLEPRLRPFFDELLIDALEETGALTELMTRLVSIPTAERDHRVWEAIEACAMQRLARLSDGRGSGTFG